jgi:hypothetical protein
MMDQEMTERKDVVEKDCVFGYGKCRIREYMEMKCKEDLQKEGLLAYPNIEFEDKKLEALVRNMFDYLTAIFTVKMNSSQDMQLLAQFCQACPKVRKK